MEQIKRIIKAMLITCGLVCGYGLYEYYIGKSNYSGRLVATFEYYTIFAKYISLIMPIAICLYFYYKNITDRLYLFLLILVCSISLILTMTRTSWVAILLTIIFICFALQKKYLLFTLVGIGALVIFILPSKFINQAKTIIQVHRFFTSEEILGQRVLCWKVSMAIIKDYPVFGLGPSKRNFREKYQQYGKEIRNNEKQNLQNNFAILEQSKEIKDKKEINDLESLSHPHNIFLNILTEIGIVGLVAFLWLFTTIFYVAIKSWRVLRKGYEKILLVGITASLTSIFLNGLTDSFWEKPHILFLWYIIGILFVVIHNISKPQLNEFT